MPDDPGAKPTLPTAAPATPASTATTATTETSADDDAPGSTAGQVAESAAEIVLGAVIAPFTGGETVTMVESIKETVEEGVDRLTHLGHHETTPKADGDDGSSPDDGSTPDDGSSEPPSYYSPDTSIDVPADDGRE